MVNPYAQPYAPTYPPPPQGNGMAVAAMVLGILAIVLCWIPFLNWGLALLAIIFGALGIGAANKRGSGKGMAIAGLVCGAIGALLGVMFWLLVVAAVRTVGHQIEKGSKKAIAEITVRELATEAYPMWSRDHASEECPRSLGDLASYRTDRDLRDPWGHEYRMYCGSNLPAGAIGFAVSSDGEDGIEGTADDIKSW
ncbi:MAG TPA: hypothetical protein VMJ10_08680 [Kofleriaceae bacterium]|nr:hypothetical protein [Kofleriaceae bacterium]